MIANRRTYSLDGADAALDDGNAAVLAQCVVTRRMNPFVFAPGAKAIAIKLLAAIRRRCTWRAGPVFWISPAKEGG